MSKPTPAARLSALETAVQALTARVARLEAPPETKPAAPAEGAVKCAVCNATIEPWKLAKADFFGIAVTPAGEHTCSPTCTATAKRNAT